MNKDLFYNSKILVTGGAGFVGSNLVKVLLKAHSPAEILIVDNLLSAEEINIPDDSKVSFIKGSIADDTVLSEIHDDFDYIFHLATYHGNQSSIHDPLADHENNTLTTLKLFNYIKDFKNLKKVVYSGAGCAVAEKNITDNAKPTTEDSPISLNMDSPYSISKIFGEYYSVYFYKQHKLPVVRARFQNVYGPGEILGAGEWRGTPATVWRNVVPTFMYKALSEQVLTLDNGGQSSRDFIYVDDICRGLIACAESGTDGDVYNLSSGDETTILELAEKIISLTNNPTPFELHPKRDWDTSICRCGSTEKAARELGFSAVTSIDEGLRLTKNWTVKNMDKINDTIDKHAHLFRK